MFSVEFRCPGFDATFDVHHTQWFLDEENYFKPSARLYALSRLSVVLFDSLFCYRVGLPRAGQGKGCSAPCLKAWAAGVSGYILSNAQSSAWHAR